MVCEKLVFDVTGSVAEAVSPRQKIFLSDLVVCVFKFSLSQLDFSSFLFCFFKAKKEPRSVVGPCGARASRSPPSLFGSFLP